VVRQPDAGARVQDVRIASPADLDVLEQIPGSCQGAVLEPHPAARRRIRHIERGDFNPPARRPGRRLAHSQVAAPADQRPADAALAQRPQRLVHRVTLGNPAQVQPHAGHQQRGSASLGVQDELAVTDRLQRQRQTPGIGQLALPASAPPQLHGRTDRDVERPVGAGRPPLGRLQHTPQIRAYRHGPTGAGRARQEAQLAVLLVIAQDLVERGQALEGSVGGVAGAGGIRGVEDEPKRDAHLRLRECEARRVMAVRPGRRRVRAGARRTGAEQGRHEQAQARSPPAAGNGQGFGCRSCAPRQPA